MSNPQNPTQTPKMGDESSRATIVSKQNLGEFEYEFQVHNVKIKKKLKDMKNQELVKIFRSLGGRSTQYFKKAQEFNERAEKVCSIMDIVEEFAQTDRELNVGEKVREKYPESN
jgi:hypothetical protein